jgi:hypothetical protein
MSPIIQPRFKAEVTIVPRNGGDIQTYDLQGITAQEIVDQYERLRVHYAENGADAYLPTEVFIAASKEPAK